MTDGLRSLDGTAWYHPQRLTLDSGAVAAGNANPAQNSAFPDYAFLDGLLPFLQGIGR